MGLCLGCSFAAPPPALERSETGGGPCWGCGTPSRSAVSGREAVSSGVDLPPFHLFHPPTQCTQAIEGAYAQVAPSPPQEPSPPLILGQLLRHRAHEKLRAMQEQQQGAAAGMSEAGRSSAMALAHTYRARQLNILKQFLRMFA